MEQESQVIKELRKANYYTHIGRYIHVNLDQGVPESEIIDYLKDSYKDNQFATKLALADGIEYLEKLIS